MRIRKSAGQRVIWLLAMALLFSCPANGQSKRAEIRGIVRDEREAVIVGAVVVLASEHGVKLETVTDGEGSFKFGTQAAGRYRLRVSSIGFAEFEQELTFVVGSPVEAIIVTLYPTINESLVVESDVLNSMLDADRAAGTTIIKDRELEALPDDPDRLAEQLQMIATSSGSAPGNATVTVDGFNSQGRLPPKSSIRSVRINPDLYSAEYDQAPYRGGRIEIQTKPGAGQFHGSGFFNFNPPGLNARDVFAPTRADTQTKRYGFQLGGPLRKNRAGILFDIESRDIRDNAIINAIVLDSTLNTINFAAAVPTPKRLTIGSLRSDWQATPMTTMVFRADFTFNRSDNNGAGGLNLADRATNNNARDASLRASATTTLNKSTLNELRVGFTLASNNFHAVSEALGINVVGSFSQGGASQVFYSRNEKRLQIDDTLSLSLSKHSFKFGVQLTDKAVTENRVENPNGTFIFGGGEAPVLDPNGAIIVGPKLITISGLEQYRRALLRLPGGTPTRFTVTRGDSSVSLNQWQVALFVQDTWRLRRNFSLNLGLRYEAQTSPVKPLSLAPRLSVAYSPNKKQTWVIRARAGIFYDRLVDSLTLESMRLNGQSQQQLNFDSPSFPNPFSSPSGVDAITSLRQLDPGIRPLASLQTQLEVEHQFRRGWKIQASDSWTSSWAVTRSRNLNAPVLSGVIDPRMAPRPLGVAKNILQFESSGRLKGHAAYVGVSQSVNKRFSLTLGYLFMDFKTNADQPFALPQNSYDLSTEWAPPFWQTRHRIFLYSVINLPWKIVAAPSLNAASGTPFNVTVGRDANGDGNFNDRPSVVAANANAIATRFGLLDPNAVNGNLPRNIGVGPSSMTVDLNVGRSVQFGKASSGDYRFKLTLNIRASNLFNHANLSAINGVLVSPLFGQSNSAGPARRIELGARFNF